MEIRPGTGPIQLPNTMIPEPTPAPSKASRPIQVASATSGDIRALPDDGATSIDAHGTPNYGDRVLKQGGGGDGRLDNYIERPKTGPLSLSQIDLSAIGKKPAPQQPQASAAGPDLPVDVSVPQLGRPPIQSGGGGNGSL